MRSMGDWALFASPSPPRGEGRGEGASLSLWERVAAQRSGEGGADSRRRLTRSRFTSPGILSPRVPLTPTLSPGGRGGMAVGGSFAPEAAR
jgi:hypothetical protein